MLQEARRKIGQQKGLNTAVRIGERYRGCPIVDQIDRRAVWLHQCLKLVGLRGELLGQQIALMNRARSNIVPAKVGVSLST